MTFSVERKLLRTGDDKFIGDSSDWPPGNAGNTLVGNDGDMPAVKPSGNLGDKPAIEPTGNVFVVARLSTLEFIFVDKFCADPGDEPVDGFNGGSLDIPVIMSIGQIINIKFDIKYLWLWTL